MSIETEIFQRTALLLGEENLEQIGQLKVIIFGVGGVGSWCAETLVRTGIKNLTIVDSDLVAASNINRQLMATTKTIGKVKVDVLKERLLDINPNARITTFQEIYNEDTRAMFNLDSYDYIVDAIDSLSHKADLIRTATKTKATLVSSMGAALKIDPSRIQVAEFWKVAGCPLAAALRRKMKKGEKPSKKFFCVYSDEVLPNQQVDLTRKSEELKTDSTQIEGNQNLIGHDWNVLKAQINGTFMHITAMFGLRLASIIIQDIYEKQMEKSV